MTFPLFVSYPSEKMNRSSSLTALILLLSIYGGYGQSTGDGDAEECVEVYGFLPCSRNAWGLLFLIVVYEILLSIAGQYIARGSELFFRLIGPGIFGNSLFQLLGTVPQVILVFVTSFTVSSEAAQQQATYGVGLVVGSTVMLLTLVWGLSVVVGSYDLSEGTTTDEPNGTQTLTGHGVITDAETSFTARLVLVSMIPVLLLVPATAIHSHTVQRVVVLIALIITVLLFFGYLFNQIFQPWVSDRRLEYLVSKYTKNKLLTLFSKNGRADLEKIHELFDTVDKDKSGSISAPELRVLLLGVKIQDDLTTEKDLEDILESFDTSGDGRIGRDEFTRRMTKLISDLSEKSRINRTRVNSEGKSELQQRLLPTGGNQNTSIDWFGYARALTLVIGASAILMLLSQPLSNSVTGFSRAADIPTFFVSYFVTPLAMNYGTAMQSITSATQRSKRSISLTLSALYGGVYMNNIVGLISFLVPVYVLDLSVNVIAEAAVVLVVCLVLSLITSFYTKFPRWVGYMVLLFYPISLALIYLLTSVLHLP